MFRKLLQQSLWLLPSFLFVSYLTPFHIHPQRVFYNDLLVLIGLFSSILLISKLREQKNTIPSVAYFFLVLILLDQWHLLGDENAIPTESLVRDFYLLSAALACLLGANWHLLAVRASSIIDAIAVVNLLAALFSVVMQCLQIAGVDATPWVMFIAPDAQPFMRPYANVAQPNQLALLFCFALASVWWLYQQWRLGRVAALMLVLALLWGIVLTQSRIGWIILPLFVLIGLSKIEGQRPVSIWLLVGLLLVYASLVISLPSLGRWLGFASGSVLEHVGGRSERLVLWRQAWRMAAEHPWFGVGWGRFGAEQVKMAADFTPTIYAEHSHNLILNFAAELGWPVTLVLFGGLGWWFLQTCVLPKPNLSVRFASLCFVAVGVHSMVEYPLWYAYILIPMALLMGVVHRLRWPDNHREILISVNTLRATALVGLLLMAYATWDYQRVVRGFAVLRERPDLRLEQSVALQKPTWTLYGHYFDYFKIFNLLPYEGMSAEDIAFVERMSQRFGFVHILNKLAEVYVLNGQPAKAARTMQTLQRLHPFAYPAYFDYWQTQAKLDERYRQIFMDMPARDVQ